MKNITETVYSYLAAWHQPDHETVKQALEQCCVAEITYTDKQTSPIKGIDAFVNLIMESYEKVPGRTFSILTEPEYFDHHCYYTWGINIPGVGEKAGHDYFEYDENNLIVRIVGFLPV